MCMANRVTKKLLGSPIIVLVYSCFPGEITITPNRPSFSLRCANNMFLATLLIVIRSSTSRSISLGLDVLHLRKTAEIQ